MRRRQHSEIEKETSEKEASELTDEELISPSRVRSDTVELVTANIETDWARGSSDSIQQDLENSKKLFITEALEKTNYHGGLARKLLLEQGHLSVHSEELRKLPVG